MDTNEHINSTLTNRQGHPVTNNQSIRTVGNRGPTTLANYDFLEKITGEKPIFTYTLAKMLRTIKNKHLNSYAFLQLYTATMDPEVSRIVLY